MYIHICLVVIIGIYVHIHMYIHTYIHTHIHACIHKYTYVHTVYTCTFKHIIHDSCMHILYHYIHRSVHACYVRTPPLHSLHPFPPSLLGHIARPGVIGVSHAQYFTLTLQYTSYHYQMCGVVWCVSIEECEQCSGMLDPQFAFA